MDIFSPLDRCIDWVVYGVLPFKKHTQIGESAHFFLYDSIKIVLLLLLINFLMAIIRHYFPIEKIKTVLISRKWYYMDYVLAACFGVITPFCSCSSIPLFIGFLRSGIPLGVTFTFLITSPLVNEASLILFPALFGWRLTVLYNSIGMVVGILGGVVIEHLKLRQYIEPAFLEGKKNVIIGTGKEHSSFSFLISQWWIEGWSITKTLIPYIIFGVGIGAVIHGFLPVDFFHSYLSSKQWWAIPVAALLGVPLYANSVSVIPVMEALVSKGVSVGVALTFMTSVVTLSIPEALILKKVMKLPLLATFFGITTIGIMCMGFVLFFIFG